MRSYMAAALAALCAASSCEPTADAPGACFAGSTRCVGSSAQLCSSSGAWTEVMDCAEVSEQSDAPFSCQPSKDGHTCLPDTEGGTP